MRLRSSLTAAWLTLLPACAVNPATGERQFSLISESQEIQMGRDGASEVSGQLGLVDNPALQRYVSDLGGRLAAASERPGLPWRFEVVDDPVVNAFALPGGFIYVTRGILAHFDSEAELAGVLGHEIGHVTARHSVTQMSRQQLQQLGLGVGMILSEDVRNLSGVLGAGLQLLNLRYSRGDETESDELGLRYIARLGYDPEAMIGVFQMLAEVGGGGEGRIPEWQLTHPYPENREQHMRGEIAAAGIAPGGRTARDEYLDRIDGLVFGENPREGYFKEVRFLHPDLQFELSFPSGWRTVNQRSAVAAIEPGEQAVVVLSVVADATDPAAELREFLGQEGVTGGSLRQESAGGVDRVRAPFEAATENGTVRGEIAFLRHQGRVFRILGYGSGSGWGAHAASVGRTISSFAVLTDRNVLAVQPWTLDIRRLPSATSLRSYAASNRSPVPMEELARLNRVAPGDVLSAGTRVKWVEGSPLP